jgi:hypothetical protein
VVVQARRKVHRITLARASRTGSAPAADRAHVDTDVDRPAITHLGHGSAQLQRTRRRVQARIALGPLQPAHCHEAGAEGS